MDEASVHWRNSTHHLSFGCLELQGNEIMMSVFNVDKCVYALQMCVCASNNFETHFVFIAVNIWANIVLKPLL